MRFVSVLPLAGIACFFYTQSDFTGLFVLLVLGLVLLVAMEPASTARAHELEKILEDEDRKRQHDAERRRRPDYSTLDGFDDEL